MNAPKKILLIQLFSNGDCLYATAVARQIKQDDPSCHLIWVIADYCKNIIANNPFVDEIFIIKDINHNNWKRYWKGFQHQIRDLKLKEKIDKVVFTQIIDSNYANYDYCIRSAIFRGYEKPLQVPIQPVLRLTEEEKKNVEQFVSLHRLSSFHHVILLEFSPKSGQSKFSLEAAISVVEKFNNDNSIVFIFSASGVIPANNHSVIDASKLSLREIAHLSRYCTLLIGCSSGTTWVTTSDAGKQLPMVQVLDSNAYWFNSVVNDHKRFGLPVDHIIEIGDSNEEVIYRCIHTIIKENFSSARLAYHQDFKMQFRITRGIISYLLGKGKIKFVIRHIRINFKLFGWNIRLLKSIFLGITTFPVTNFLNKMKKKNQNIYTK